MLPDRATKGERSMSEKRYRATLTTEEETLLRDIINRGKHGARKRRRAQALLCAHEGCTDTMPAERTGMQRRSVEALRQRFVEEGFETTLEGKPRGCRPTVNKLRDRHPAEAVVNQKREGIMGKKVVLKQFETWWKKRTMKVVQRNGNRISAGTGKCRSRS
jgi:hypothetical protein